MLVVRFKPRTIRERQLVDEHGDIWREVKRERVQCFNGEIGVFIESKNGLHSRWVQAEQVVIADPLLVLFS